MKIPRPANSAADQGSRRAPGSGAERLGANLSGASGRFVSMPASIGYGRAGQLTARSAANMLFFEPDERGNPRPGDARNSS